MSDDFRDDNVDYDDYDTSGSTGSKHAAAAGSFPYRGLAMILIAVAVAFGLWALYGLTQGGGANNDAASDNTEATVSADPTPSAQAPTNAVQPSQPEQPIVGAESAAPAEESSLSAPGEPNQPEQPEQPEPPAGADNPPAPQADVVNVYNNSTITGLAAGVSQSLREQGVEVGVESGNIAETQMVLGETTVFFDPAVEGAETKARELADRVGGVARENVDNLPVEATEGGALALVLTGQVNL